MPAVEFKSAHRPVLGCIADDVTGATDLAINLVQGGMRVVQLLGIPTQEELKAVDADAIVIALKTRSLPKNEAIAQSIEALAALRTLSIPRFFFKYCSTFDSTEQGNIGPVADAFLDALGATQTVFCPAFPRNGRTVYQGHLFVHGRLLSESGMENHPLNPMHDSDLVRFLGKQTDRTIGLLTYDDIEAQNAQEKLLQLAADNVNFVMADACNESHLMKIAKAVADSPLVTGGSGIARYLPDAYRQIGLFDQQESSPRLPDVAGRSLIISGSCSAMTNRQVAWMSDKCPSWELDVDSILTDANSYLNKLLQWATGNESDQPTLIYSTASPEKVAEHQSKRDGQLVARAIEEFLANAAKQLVRDQGVRRLVVAGGETSGAVVAKLGVRALRIGPEICTGVPWTESLGDQPLALALKSGNFGDDDFFERALGMLS